MLMHSKHQIKSHEKPKAKVLGRSEEIKRSRPDKKLSHACSHVLYIYIHTYTDTLSSHSPFITYT